MEKIPVVKTPSPASQIIKEKIKSDSLLHKEDVIEATLISKSPREAFFDIGKFSTGIVYGQELINAKELLKKLGVGKTIPAKILEIDGERGYVELSLAEADQQRLWQDAKELQESGEVIKVTIAGANAGGLITAVKDLKAFLPVSRLSNEHYPKADGDRQKIIEELKKFIGEEMDVKIIDLNPRSKKLIVSEREILSPNLKELLAGYKAGQAVDVLVSGIADFGVFVKLVDNPQIEGLIHISELDHRLVSNPKEKVELNAVLKAQIIEIRDDGRVFLSLKALAKDPWVNISERYGEGQEVQGTIYKFNPFGSVVDLDTDLQGIIHVSEFGGLEEMKKELEIGKQYSFVIGSIRPEEKRLILKLKK